MKGAVTIIDGMSHALIDVVAEITCAVLVSLFSTGIGQKCIRSRNGILKFASVHLHGAHIYPKL